MVHKIFLSHNHNDKPLVEPVAVALAKIFGEDQVFYDSWSIKPGDGIIDKMNNGLDAPEFVFFFVSKNSITSGMVKLEWQNALYAASKGMTKIVPVRVDDCDMPPVLRQTLFIDMCAIGLDAAISQIVSVTHGHASFTPQHQGFSNLTYSRKLHADGSMEISVIASHLMEPSHGFVFLTKNSDGEINIFSKGGGMDNKGFKYNCAYHLQFGIVNGFFVKPIGRALTPSHPIRFEVKKITDTPIDILGVLHEKGENNWIPVPLSL